MAAPDNAVLRRLPRWFWPLLTAAAIFAFFIALNHKAYDGYFQDDELDTLTWAPSRPVGEYLRGFFTPLFNEDNFRPTGHLFFTLMGKAIGLNFPPWITPLFLIHFLNALLLWLMIRRFGVKFWLAMAGIAFFVLSATALDAWWKPMYVFDLLCTTFSLASLLLYMERRWILSFVSFWLAYKAKEMAVMMPAILVAYEFWFGEKKFVRLIPFLVTSLSFGMQGIFLNPNTDNDYTFRFTLAALTKTVPFYARRMFLIPWAGLSVLALAFIRDKRIWFALVSMTLVMVPLLFLPGRMFNAYSYLPLAFALLAFASAFSRVHPAWGWLALLLWMPWNVHVLRRERAEILQADDAIFSFVDEIFRWSHTNPGYTTFVYEDRPDHFRDWGVSGAWTIGHDFQNFPAYYFRSIEGRKALALDTVAYGKWDYQHNRLTIEVRAPGSSADDLQR